MRRSALGLIVLLSISLLWTAPAPAGKKGGKHHGGKQQPSKQLGFTLIAVGQPSFFKFTGKPKQVLRGTLLVKSIASSQRTILLRPADVGTGATGGLTYGTRKPRRVGRWVHLSRRRVVLPPGGSVAVSFKVKVPKKPGKGQRFAGIVGMDRFDVKQVHKKGRGKAGHPLSLKFLPRFAMTVEVDLPGRRTRHIEAGGYQTKPTPSGLYLEVPLRNTGNSLIEKSSGSATVSQDGRALVTQPVELSQFVPGTEIRYLLRVPGQPVEGSTYEVSGFLNPDGAPKVSLDGSATLASEEASQLEQQTGKDVKGGSSTPWLLIVLFVVFLILAGFVTGIYLQQRRQRTAPDRYDPYDW